MNGAFAGIGFDYSIPQDDALTLHAAGLLGYKPGGYAELRAISGGRVTAQRFVPANDREAIAAAVAELKQSANVYMGAVIRLEQRARPRRACHARSLWADGDTPESVDRIMGAKPSWVIETSPGKVQGFWAIREHLAPQFVRQANLRFAARLGADTNACDVARILRVPGTFNYRPDS